MHEWRMCLPTILYLAGSKAGPTFSVTLLQGPFLPADPLVAVGTSMLQQSGKTYFESGRRYMQSWTGVVSGGMLHYHFDINTEYGGCSYCLMVVCTAAGLLGLWPGTAKPPPSACLAQAWLAPLACPALSAARHAHSSEHA